MSHDTKSYSVVELLDSKSRAVIHNAWKIYVGQQLYCHYPKSDAHEKAQRGAPPMVNADWPALLPIKVLGEPTDSWEDAVRTLKRLEYASNVGRSLDTETERKRRPPKRLYEPPAYSSDDDKPLFEITQQSTEQTKTPLVTVYSSPAKKICVGENDGSVVIYNCVNSTPPKELPATASTDSSVLEAIAKLQGSVARVEAMLAQLAEGRSQPPLANAVRKSELIVEDIIPVPFSTEEDLENFDKTLQQCKESKENALIAFSSIGGLNVGQSVRTIMRKVATPAVWSRFNRIGRVSSAYQKKRPFAKLALYSVIYRACKRIHQSNLNEHEYVNAVCGALRHFPYQRGGPQYKEPVKGAGNNEVTLLNTSSDEEDAALS